MPFVGQPSSTYIILSTSHLPSPTTISPPTRAPTSTKPKYSATADHTVRNSRPAPRSPGGTAAPRAPPTPSACCSRPRARFGAGSRRRLGSRVGGGWGGHCGDGKGVSQVLGVVRCRWVRVGMGNEGGNLPLEEIQIRVKAPANALEEENADDDVDKVSLHADMVFAHHGQDLVQDIPNLDVAERKRA